MSTNPTKILFVCTGNICRSPLAQAVFQKLVDETGLAGRFAIDSAGTDHWEVGKSADPRMKRVGETHGVAINHRARQLSRADIAEHDLILAMDKNNLADARALVTGEQELRKIRLFREFDPQGGPSAEVPDPYYDGDGAFEHVYRMVDRTARSLLEELVDERGSRSSKR